MTHHGDHGTGAYQGRHNLDRLASLEDWQLENENQDLRGHVLHTPQGTAVGRVKDMLVDLDQERVVALRLDSGQVVDVDDVDIRDGKAVLLGGATGAAGGEQRIPIVEEEMQVGKRVTDMGTVRVRSRIVETPVSETVALRREHVELERRPVQADVTGTEAEALLRESVLEVTERGEEAVVGKTARVVEEVVVRKGVETHQERVDDSVRRTEVEVDRVGGRDGPMAGDTARRG